MVNVSNKIMGACIVLMMEQYKKRKKFAMEGVLFTKEELITWGNKLFPMNSEVRDSSIRPNSLNGNCLQSGSEDSMREYYRLCHPENSVNYKDTLENGAVYQVLKNHLPQQFRSVEAFLDSYFAFINSQSILTQERSDNMDSRCAVWIAAAALTYNEYMRTRSSNLLRYAFQVRTIDHLARKYMVSPPLSGFNTLVGSNCTKGGNGSTNPFLITANEGKRRIAKNEEVSAVIPDNLPLDFKVITIKGSVPVSALIDFVRNQYTSFESNETESIVDVPEPQEGAYTKEDFLSEVYMGDGDYDKLIALIRRKKNVVLQGAPGTGKTYCARKLAYAAMGEQDENRVCAIQFHQSYSYEDFVEGYRPKENGYALEKGVFYRFCTQAQEDRERSYFFIIDEMNRGNLSKIFGELFTLIEAGKRDEKIKLVYSKESFAIPENVHIIGLMNTADRSLAMIDYALRRRFGFFTMKPGFDTDGFKRYKANFACSQFDSLIEQIKKLNKEIAEDASLGSGFCIGHSFFCEMDEENTVDETRAILESIVENEILPLLEEYWFEEPDKVKQWDDNLRGALQ